MAEDVHHSRESRESAERVVVDEILQRCRIQLQHVPQDTGIGCESKRLGCRNPLHRHFLHRLHHLHHLHRLYPPPQANMPSPSQRKQLDASLDKPIDKDAPPTIYGSKLTPELATAALNLAVDFVKQQQALVNKHLLWHKITVLTTLLSVLLYLVPNATVPRGTRTVGGWLLQFAMINKKELFTACVVAAMAASMLFTLLSKFTEAVFKSRTDEIVRLNGANVFHVDLTKLATEKVSKGSEIENTQVIVYRDTPIALVSVIENQRLSSNESLVMGVSTIGCRRVYLKSGLLEDLLDWALVRTKNVQQQGKHKAGQSMKLLVDAYSFDEPLKQALKKKGFSLVQSYKVEGSRILGGLFGVRRELWGLQFHFETKKEK